MKNCKKQAIKYDVFFFDFWLISIFSRVIFTFLVIVSYSEFLF